MINSARTMTTRANRLLLIPIIAILFICIFESACGQTPEDEMVKLLGGKYWSEASSVEKTNDGGYIIVGTNNSDGISSENLWLVKTDSNGVTKWEKTLGGPKSIGRSILRTDDDTYLIAAITELKDNTELNAWIIKTNSAGGIDKNETVIDEHGRKQVYSILKTADNNYTLVGSTESSIIDSDIWLVRLFNNGSLNWSRSLNLNGSEFGRSAAQTKDGGYLIAGYTIPPTSKRPEILLIATDSKGNKTDNTNITNLSNNLTKLGINRAYSILKTKDGYVILGANESLASDKKKCLLVKFFEDGIEDWNCSFDDTGYNAARYVIETKDGEYVIVGETNSNDHGSLDAWIAKINSTGSKVWSRTIGGTGYDIGNSVLQADDDGFVIAGATGSYGNRTLNGWLFKVNSTGYEEWNTTLGLASPLIIKETVPEDFNATFVDLDKRYAKPIFDGLNSLPLTILKIILILAGMAVVIIALFKLFKDITGIFAKKQLFVEDIVNATANDALKDTMAGLSEQMRGKILEKLDVIGRTILIHKDDLGPIKHPPEFCYVPKGADLVPLKELTDSLKDALPEAKPFLPFLNFIYPKPYGIKVNCTLQGHKDQSEILGLTLNVANAKDARQTVIQTLWGESSEPSACVKNPLHPVQKAESLREISSYLEIAGLFGDAFNYRNEAFKTDTDKRFGEMEKISELAELKKIAELIHTYNDLAKKNKNNWNLFKEYHKESFYSMKKAFPQTFSECKIESFHDTGPVYFYLANVYKKYRFYDEALELFQISQEKGVARASARMGKIKLEKSQVLIKAGMKLHELCRYSEAKGYLQAALTLSTQDNEAKSLLEKAEMDLAKEKKPYARCQGLLDPASWWLAVEITKWAMLESKPSNNNSCDNCYYLAGVYVFSGTMKSYMGLKKNSQEFYNMAEDDFKKAKSICDKWYRPYMLLGDLSFMISKNRLEGLPSIKSAILFYEEARARIGQACNPKEYPSCGDECIAPCRGECIAYHDTDCNVEENYILTMEYLDINLIITKFLCGVLSNDEPRIKKIRYDVVNVLKCAFNKKIDINILLIIKENIERKTNNIENVRDKTIDKELNNLEITEPDIINILKDKTDCNADEIKINEIYYQILIQKLMPMYLNQIKSAKALYNFACLMGLANTYFERGGKILIPDKTYSEKYARRFLIYSLARDRYQDVWKIATTDLDLKDVASNDIIEKIKFELKKTSITKKTSLVDLAEDKNFDFKKEVDRIIGLVCLGR